MYGDWTKPRRPKVPVGAWSARTGVSLLEQIADVGFLLRVFRTIRAKGGPAAGLSGIGPRDFGDAEAANLFRQVRPMLLSGSWRPQKPRSKSIPKDNGKMRVIRIAEPVDRVIFSATHDVLAPVWDATFEDLSHGFRPARSHLTALAAIAARAETYGAYIITAADASQAFDRLRLDPVDMLHAEQFAGDRRLLDFLRVVVRGHEENRAVGVDQGSAYSPLVLNAVLDRLHDKRLGDLASIGLVGGFRYADDLTYLTYTVADGMEVMQRVEQMLAPLGLAVKEGTGRPVDIRQERVELLGFSVGAASGQLTFQPGAKAWGSLQCSFANAYDSRDPVATARDVVRGWLAALGPAELVDADYERLRGLNMEFGFPTEPVSKLRCVHREAAKRWLRVRNGARDESPTPSWLQINESET